MSVPASILNEANVIAMIRSDRFSFREKRDKLASVIEWGPFENTLVSLASVRLYT